MHLNVKVLIRKGTEDLLKIQDGNLIASPAPAVYNCNQKQEDLEKQVTGPWPSDVLLVTGQIVTNSNYY